MATILIDSELLGALIAAADYGADNLAEMAADLDQEGEDCAEAADDYRQRSAAADAAVNAGRRLWASNQCGKAMKT